MPGSGKDKMQLNVPTNWSSELLEGIKDCPISTVYGRLPREIVGGGRPAAALPEISRKDVQTHIAQVRELGWDFNYVLNAACLGNLEYSQDGYNKIRELLDWMCEAGVTSTTVSVPYLIEIIKEHYSQLRVVASVFCHIDSIELAKFYQNLGVAEITIVQSYNRQFKFLEKFRKKLDCDLQIIVNNACLLGCPYRRYHANINAHSSQSGQENLPFDYPVISCTRVRLSDPGEVVKSPWIRPEDLHYYEAIGINRFKLSGRTKTTEWLITAIKAYTERHSPDNFAELLSVPNGYGSYKRKSYSGVPLVDLVVNNHALDNFLPFFLKNGCQLEDCRKCGYCDKVAMEAVLTDPMLNKQAVDGYKRLLEKHFTR